MATTGHRDRQAAPHGHSQPGLATWVGTEGTRAPVLSLRETLLTGLLPRLLFSGRMCAQVPEDVGSCMRQVWLPGL